MTLSCAPATIVAGYATTCKAHVDGGATGGAILYYGSQIMDGEGLDSNGNVVFQNVLAGSSAGNYTLSANYLGDINFKGGGSPNVNVSIVSQAGSSNLAAGVSPAQVQNGGQISVNVTVAPGATQPVTVSIGNQTLAVLNLDANGSASALLNFTGPSGPGSYSLVFSYPGDNNIGQGTTTASLTVTQPPTTAPPSGKAIYSYSITQPDGSTSGYDANGNIIAFNDTVNGQWTAGYDSLDRIISASVATTTSTATNVSAQSFCWVYDSFGNRKLQARAPGALSQCTATHANGENYVAATYNTNNQLSGLSGEAVVPGVDWNGTIPPPDASGNPLQDPNNNYWYDGEGRLCAQSASTNYSAITVYLYDAEGHRVAKGTVPPQADPCDFSTNNFVMTNEYVIGPDGGQLSELTWSKGVASPLHTNASANGKLLATYDYNSSGQSPSFHFQFSDWLGTRRLQTDLNGNPEQSYASGAYGDLLQSYSFSSNASDGTENHFTNKERDVESGLDYFGARYYASFTGRFNSPDWSAAPTPIPYASLSAAQSLNLYVYTRNNPLKSLDFDGHIGLNNGPVDECNDTPSCQTDTQKLSAWQSQSQSSKGPGFLTRLGQRISNFFHNKGPVTNAELDQIQGAFTSAYIVPGSVHVVDETNPYLTTAMDAASIGATLTGHPVAVVGIGAESIYYNPDPTNVGLTIMGLVPGVVGETAIPLTVLNDVGGFTGGFITNTVIAPTLMAIPADTMNDGYGHTIPTPEATCTSYGIC